MRALRLATTRGLCAILASLFVIVPLCGLASAADTNAAATIVLQGATIHTMTEQGTFVGSVVVENGKIKSVGENVQAPEGATVIDLTGHTLTPGLIDSRSVLWLTAAARGEAGSRGALNILDGVNPFLEDWHEVSRQGVTSVYVQPSNTGVFGGRGAVLRVGPGSSVKDLVVANDVAVQAAMGITGDTVRDRAAQIQRFRRAFQAVKDGEDPPNLAGNNNNNNNNQQQNTQGFGRGRRGGAEDLQQGRRGRFGRGGGGRGAAVTQPNKTKELIELILDRKIPLRLEAHQEDVVQAAFELADEFEFDLIVDGLSSPGEALSEVAARQARVVVGPAWETGAAPSYRQDRDDQLLSNIAESTNRWALATYSPEARGSRMLRVQAAAAIASGVEAESALRAVTVEAARILGVADQVGSIAPGMQADLAIFAGDPLDPAASTRMVMTRGEVVYENADASPNNTGVAAVELPEVMPLAYVIRTQRMLNANGEMQPAEMFVQNGLISAIGRTISAPEDVPVFDVGDAVITPGLVNAHSYLGQQSMLNDDTEADSSQLRAADVIEASSPVAKKMLEGGFVNVGFAPTSVNPSAGVMAHVRLGAKKPVVANDIAGKFVLSSDARSNDRLPSSLVGQVIFLDSLFGGSTPVTRLYVPDPVARAIERERRSNVDAVVTGGRPAVLAAETAPEVQAAITLTSKYDFTSVLLGPERIQGLTSDISGAGMSIIARPFDDNDYDLYCEQLAEAAQARIPVAFSGETPRAIRMTAAMAVNAGMPSEVALRGLTAVGADVVGMPAGTARLNEGSVADFVVWTGSPLDLRAVPARVVVQSELETVRTSGRITD